MKYESLVEQFCSLGRLEDISHVARGGSFEVNDVVFSWVHDPNLDPRTAFLCAAYGPPPAEREASTYYELLKRNFLNFASSGPTFCISPVTGDVVMVERMDIDTASAPAMIRSVIEHSEAAADWRSTRFLRGRYMLRTADEASPDSGNPTPLSEETRA